MHFYTFFPSINFFFEKVKNNIFSSIYSYLFPMILLRKAILFLFSYSLMRYYD